MIYIEYKFQIEPLQPGTEILIAELGAAGFESFVETETGVEAYIPKPDWNPDILKDIQVLNSAEFKIEYAHSEIEQVNWNEEWEKNFAPILVDEKCFVRAPFHETRNFEYEIVIEPKMSFGTGHHETTFMMLQHILENDFQNKTVLDMGCGTAVLAILAEMRGAKSVEAIDIDEWCYENSLENIEKNKSQNIAIFLGGAELLENRKYDVIIANINRNILLQDMDVYRNSLEKEGALYLSGFYHEDLSIIQERCNNLGLKLVSHKERNRWVAAKFKLGYYSF